LIPSIDRQIERRLVLPLLSSSIHVLGTSDWFRGGEQDEWDYHCHDGESGLEVTR